MSIISVRDLVVEYDGRRVLESLNLDVETGQITVLPGGSGSGKSTLLRLLLASVPAHHYRGSDTDSVEIDDWPNTERLAYENPTIVGERAL